MQAFPHFWEGTSSTPAQCAFFSVLLVQQAIV
jgi:hypothetical protein